MDGIDARREMGRAPPDLAVATEDRTRQPGHLTPPRVYYKNLYRFTWCFIGGNVALEDVDECDKGAQVTPWDGAGQTVGTATTNNLETCASTTFRLTAESTVWRSKILDTRSRN